MPCDAASITANKLYNFKKVYPLNFSTILKQKKMYAIVIFYKKLGG